jgi:hypothetical protein
LYPSDHAATRDLTCLPPPPSRSSSLSQNLSCDSRSYHHRHSHHLHPHPSPLARAPGTETAGRPGRLLLARLDHHTGGRGDHRLAQDSPLLLPKEAWADLDGPPTGYDANGELEEDYCWPTVNDGRLAMTNRDDPRAADVRGGGTLGGGGLWLLSGTTDRRLEPPLPPRGSGRETAAASPTSPSDVTTASTTSSETYASKSTGSSASSSRSVNRGRSRP